MLAVFQDFVDELEPHINGGAYRVLANVLESFSTNTDTYSIICCDGARAIVQEPTNIWERALKLHRYIIDECCPSSDYD